MNKQAWIILVVVLSLVGVTGAFLGTQQARQKLGTPGVKVVNVPIYGEDKKVAGTNSVALPERVLDYVSQPLPIQKITLDWLPKDTVYGNRLYQASDGFVVLNDVVLMGGDRTSIHQPQYCLTGSGWRIDSTEQTSIRIDRPHEYDLPVMKLMLTRNVKNEAGAMVTQRGIFIYWFVADNQLTADHKQRMWWLARDMLQSGVLQRWAFVRTICAYQPGQEDVALKRLKQFIAASVPEYQLAAGPAPALLHKQ